MSAAESRDSAVPLKRRACPFTGRAERRVYSRISSRERIVDVGNSLGGTSEPGRYKDQRPS